MLIRVIVQIRVLKGERVLIGKSIEVTPITRKATPLCVLHDMYTV